jgi:Uma2 family endonuclease
MALQAHHQMTPGEFLAFERSFEPSDEILKHEFIDGDVVAMAGASREHIVITFNVAKVLDSDLAAHGCEVYSNEMRVWVDDLEDYFYPDAQLVCEKPEFVDGRRDTINNPVLIVEVLSPSTARYDRTRKFEAYKRLPTLRHYLLIAQDQPLIEHFERMNDGRWAHSTYFHLESSVEIRNPDCELPLSKVYDRIIFDSQADEPTP